MELCHIRHVRTFPEKCVGLVKERYRARRFGSREHARTRFVSVSPMNLRRNALAIASAAATALAPQNNSALRLAFRRIFTVAAIGADLRPDPSGNRTLDLQVDWSAGRPWTVVSCPPSAKTVVSLRL